MSHFGGANISGRRKYDVLTFCEIIFKGPTGDPTGGLRSQVSGIRYQVSGLGSQVSGLRSQVRSLNPPRPVDKGGLRVVSLQKPQMNSCSSCTNTFSGTSLDTLLDLIAELHFELLPATLELPDQEPS